MAVCPVGGTLLCFSFFFMIHQVTVPWYNCSVAWYNLQYAFSEQSLAYFNQRNALSQLLLYFRPLS